MKKSFFALISLTAPLFAATETVFLKVPADIKVLPWESRLHHTEKSEFDKTMNRDVIKINYSLPPGTNKNTLFSISFPELQNAKWQSIDSLKLTYRGGFGHIAVGIVDKDGEHFVSKKTTVLGAEKWSTHTSSYTDASLKACHQWGGGKKKNGIMDPPLKITSLRIVIYPSYIASQLRGAPILTSTKPTPDEIRRGMNPVDLYLASLEVNGVRYGTIQPEAVKKTSRVNVEFLEIGTTAPLRKGNRKILRYCLNNPSGSAVSAKVSAKAQLALTNAQQTYSETIPLKAGEQKIISLPFHFQENGFYNVNLTLSENGGTATAKTFVSVWDPVGNDWQDSPETFFGTQCTLDLFEKEFGKYREQDYKNMRNAGVKLVRFVLRWKFVQPQKNGPLHWEIYDKIFRQLKKHGFIGYPMISNAPNWAAVPAAEKDKPAFVMSCAPDNKLYAEFAAKVAERYKDYTCYFQIWNEPYAHHYYWGGSPETYADMLKESYSAIKKVNPNAKICAGAAWDEVFFKAKGSYDFWPFHCHSGVEILHSAINRHRKMAGDTADMSVFWNDETGFSVDPFADGSEIKKASEIARKAILSRAEGLSAHVWFVYRGAPNAPTNPRDNFPAVDEKNRCRPVVIAHNNMVRHIRQSKIAGKYYRPGSGEAYLFRQKDKQILAFWRSGLSKGQMISMIFDSPFSGSLSNLFGSETVYASQGRTATMMLTEEPQIKTKSDFL